MTDVNGMDALFSSMRTGIEKKIDEGYKRFIIFPYGSVGIKAKNILNTAYGILEEAVIDNHLCKYNPKIKELDYLENIDRNHLAVILATTNGKIHGQLKIRVAQYFAEQQIIDVYTRYNSIINARYRPKCGKYSYGSLLCDDYVEEICAFCSFAPGVAVAPNHALNYITTHPMLYAGPNICCGGGYAL